LCTLIEERRLSTSKGSTTLENVLMKAYMLMFLKTQWIKQERIQSEPFVILSSVSLHWWQTLVRRPPHDPESPADCCVRHRIRRMLSGESLKSAALNRCSLCIFYFDIEACCLVSVVRLIQMRGLL